MADQEVLTVEKREWRGSAKSRQMRRDGKIPAILYGRGQETVELTLDATELSLALRRNAKLVELKGGLSESAMFKKIQWDTFYNHVLHVDFTRIDASESVVVKMPLEIRGVAPGTKMGGTVDQLARNIEIECPATKIPEALELSVNELELGQTLTAGDIVLPDGAKLVGDATQVLVTCTETVKQEEEEDETPAAADGSEPEVIGEKKDEEGGGE